MHIEEVRHAQVLGPGYALNGADDCGGSGAPQDVPQRQSARHRTSKDATAACNDGGLVPNIEERLKVHYS